MLREGRGKKRRVGKIEKNGVGILYWNDSSHVFERSAMKSFYPLGVLDVESFAEDCLRRLDCRADPLIPDRA